MSLKINGDAPRPDRHLSRNASMLVLNQVAGYLVPLVTTPYLIRVLTLESFGFIAFAQAVCAVGSMFTDYGYNYTETRNVSTNRNRSSLLVNSLWTTTAARFVIAVSFCVLVGLSTIAIPFNNMQARILLLSLGIVIGNSLMPTFFLVGMEKMRVLSLEMLVARVGTGMSIFLIVREASDVVIVPVLYSLWGIGVGSASFLFEWKRFGFAHTSLSFGNILGSLQNGLPVFVSNAFISLYTSLNTVLLGVFAPPSSVAIFSVSDKVVRGFHGFYGSIIQAWYPHISLQSQKEPSVAFASLKRLRMWSFVALSMLGVGLAMSAGLISHILTSNGASDVQRLIILMSPVPLLVGLGGIHGNLFLQGFGLQRTWNHLVRITASFALFATLLLVGVLGLKHLGLAIAVVSAEGFFCCASGLFFDRALVTQLPLARSEGG